MFPHMVTRGVIIEVAANDSGPDGILNLAMISIVSSASLSTVADIGTTSTPATISVEVFLREVLIVTPRECRAGKNE